MSVIDYAKLVASWSELRRDEYEERAAIRQHESGGRVARAKAEELAFLDGARAIRREGAR